MTSTPTVIVDAMAHVPSKFVSRIEDLKKVLTLVGTTGIGNNRQTVRLPLYMEGDNGRLSIPRSYFMEKMLGYGWDWEDHTSFPRADLVFDGELREDLDQQNGVQAVLSAFSFGAAGGILSAPPGCGKTVMALKIAVDLGCRTLVFVHSEFLLHQWRERIRQFLHVEAGLIQRDTWDLEPPIVVAMIQTLLARPVPKDVRRSFGLLCVDECHRLGARRWSETARLFEARFRLGLSATPRRKDGFENAFFWHIGPVLYRVEPKRLSPRVYQLYTGSDVPHWLKKRSRSLRSKLVTVLADDRRRTMVIAEEITKAIAENRRVIVFSERRSLLTDLARILSSYNGTVGLYVGGMTEQQRKISAQKQVILATYQFAREALDIPELDLVLMATPVADVEQAIGRILRFAADKKEPLVIDFVDEKVPYLRGLAKHRRKQYARLGYKIEHAVS